MKSSEELYKALVKNLPNITVTIFDKEMRYLISDGGGFEKMNYEPDMLIGKLIKEVMPEENYLLFESYYKSVFKGITSSFEYQINNRFIEITFLPLSGESGKIENGMVITTDITEKKISENKLRQNEAALAQAQEIAHIGSWEWDVRDNSLIWSDELYRIFGLDPSNDVITYEKYVKMLHPDTRNMVLETIEKSYKTGNPYDTEHKIIRNDGSIRIIHGQGRIITDENNIIIKLFGVAHDITDKKIAEQKLKDANKKLLHSEKLAALGRFSSHISHEIRNPLANISASAQLMLSKFKPEPPMSTYLDIIMRNSSTASRIIKELLDFASPRELILEKGDIEEVLNEVCELISARCQQNNIKLSCTNNSGKLPPVLMNQEKLQEALLNFTSNAIDAMPCGGELNININAKDHVVQVEIKDTGYGIPAENMEKIFEPFFTTKDNGTGLGVALAHQIILNHEGKLEISSTVGEGTTIQLKLPVK